VRRSPIEVLTATVLPFVVDPKCWRVCKMEGKLKQRCTTRTRSGRILITPIDGTLEHRTALSGPILERLRASLRRLRSQHCR
jgi:hypothetical protein